MSTVNPITIKQLKTNLGQLSKTSKMPAYSWGIPVDVCQTGDKLRHIPESTCGGCYATKGAYAWSNTQRAYQRRLDIYLNDRKQWVKNMIQFLNRNKDDSFRWFDSGDLLDRQHLQDIATVASNTTQAHWLPTKEYRTIKGFSQKPKNLTVRVSAPFKDSVLKSERYPINSTTLTSKAYDQKQIDGVFYCPASQQDGQCLDCRACWNSSVTTVAYKYHGPKLYDISR